MQSQQQRYRSALDKLRLARAEFSYYLHVLNERSERSILVANALKKLDTAERALTAIYEESEELVAS